MTSKDLIASLRKAYLRFRPTLWFRVTILVLLGLIVAQLYVLTASAVGCLVIVLMPLLVFVVPYWLGERKPRRLATNALPVFLIAIVVAGAISTQQLLSQSEAIPLQSFPNQSAPTMALSNGTVTPYHGAPPQSFTFHVNLTTTVDGLPTKYDVFLNLTIVRGLTDFDRLSYNMTSLDNSTNTKRGSWYVTTLQNLTDSIYGYGFSVTDRNGNWTAAGPDFGPLIASGPAYYSFFAQVTAFSMILPFSFYYVILFMWWYTRRAREVRTRKLGGELEIPKEKPVTKPEAPGKTTKAAAFTCTNCGADVDESDEKCPKCGAVFED